MATNPTSPVQIAIELASKYAYVPGETAGVSEGASDFSETILFGQQRDYSIAVYLNGEVYDLTGWQFRLSAGIAVQYVSSGSPVASVVIAQNDVANFTLGGDGNNELAATLDCNTDEFLDAITDPSVSKFTTGRAELWGRPSSSEPWQPMAQWSIQAQGAVFDVTQTPGTSASSYYTAAQMDLKLGPTITLLKEGNQVVMRESGSIVAAWDLPA